MNTFGNFSQQWNGADTCFSFERMLLPMPSDLVYIEKFAINVSSRTSTYWRKCAVGFNSPPKLLLDL